MFEISGKVAVVTGGASGIGLATAEVYLKKGAKVVISDINETTGAEVIKDLKSNGFTDVEFKKADASSEEGVKALVKYAVDTFGSLDIMFNNAGVVTFDNVLDLSYEDYRREIAIDLDGVFLGMKYAANQMRSQGNGGAIINTSSIAGGVGMDNLIAYNAAKGGVNIMSKSAALALAEYKITDFPSGKAHGFNRGMKVRQGQGFALADSKP